MFVRKSFVHSRLESEPCGCAPDQGPVSFCLPQLSLAPAEGTTRLQPPWCIPLTFLTPTPRAGSATGPSGCREPLTSASASPCLTSGILPTWWSCWTATPTASWSVSMGGTAHLCPLTSLWILSFCTSSLIASIRPRDLLSYTKVTLPSLLEGPPAAPCGAPGHQGGS